MAGEDITVAQLRQLLGVQDELRQQADSRWRNAQRVLVSLLETFAPEEVDRRLKSGLALDSLGVEELAQLVSQKISTRSRTPQPICKETDCSQEVQELKRQLQANQEESGKLRTANQRLTGEVKSLREERDGLQNELTALRQVTSSQVKGSKSDPQEEPAHGSPNIKSVPEPDWMTAWRKLDTFDRDSTVLRLMGETGLARRPLIEGQVAEMLGIKRAGGSIRALMSRLVGLNLIEIFRPWEADGAGTGGRFPDLVRLTDQGQLAFWVLSGNRPKANEYDLLLERHVSPEHTLLNLQAADALGEASYRVNLTPPEITLTDGSLFRPDLVIVDGQGEIHYVEVERDTEKNVEQRQAKWRNFVQASRGQLFVVCDNRSCMRKICSEINFYLGNQPMTISLTNLVEIQAGKRGDGDSIWLEVKNRKI